ncbi:uncharacterized protein LOC107225167 [Neodiprion lecontei]|uniref:Uncharacterized protein LOC107225167 n=1 Tax=Neodiprion lecontei TaxID=441921 RepID=A0A6J0C3Q9_NEOLC|nr:uncharacterized protein LOC107225167 [Neodiprion lecontei]
MISNTLRFSCTTVFLLTLLLFEDSNGKPTIGQTINPLGEPAFLDSSRKSCTPETESICQRCAKKTKSPVVYPWCCTNHEGAREWCENYLFYGLP